MRTAIVLLLATAVAGVPLVTVNDDHEMKLHLMPDMATNYGAVCLDGTPAGFYFAPAWGDAANANNWQIYFQGGGWCYDEMDCLGRSKGSLGSSTGWGPTSSMGGIMSSDCTINPDFCQFNRVHMAYCDGNSFSGNRDDPVEVNGTKLYFRGRRIIDAVFRTLYTMGLAEAENVLLTGCSAGGLATYLHADYVGSLLGSAVSLKKYKAASISGFFLLHNTVEGLPVYPDEMKYIFTLANSTNGLNAKCIANKTGDDQWQCNFAQESYKFIDTPFFALNSALDSWQTGCIYTAEPVPKNSTQNGDCGAAPGWKDCSANPEQCTTDQIKAMVQYEDDFMIAMNSSATYANPSNGAFIYSCHTHCAAQSSGWNKFAIGGTTMQQAVSLWWAQEANDAPANSNNYVPCLYGTSTKPYACNPTCQ
eukprot:CAMPEP_0114555252 /NCGR_PEP_ID=MMETSP0114-20121206/8651_1 /TAXON_ID=31324 /ORGANISM="Goniomonas sp, Strain m" /LENGTH=419 /DNA_ID=CAMNT_0001740367 /DNA_START=11 /DNA_END=1270 /DNA_ORIENTATION=-